MTRLILDCDTGTDDAVAIFAAALHPDLTLLAVTTVNGNVPLENTTDNTLRVLDHIGSEVPVYPGAARPLMRPDFPVPRHILNGDKPEFQVLTLDLPPAVSSANRQSAVSFLIEHYLSDDGPDTVLVATGPLTNVALALAAEPRLAERIPRLVLMGGSRGWGNVSAVAEFNIWVDPEAAEAVLTSGIRDITIVPLDATHSAPVTLEDCDALHALGSNAATASSALIRHRIVHYPDAEDAVKASAPVHDAICVAALVHPEVLEETGFYPVHVETAGARTLGEMVIDTRPWTEETANATVALRANPEVFVRFLTDAFRQPALEAAG